MSENRNLRRTKFAVAVNGVAIPCLDYNNGSRYEATIVDTLQSGNSGYVHGPKRYSVNFDVIAVGEEAAMLRSIHETQSLCQIQLGMRNDGGEWSFSPGESWELAEIVEFTARGFKIGDIPVISLTVKALRYTNKDGVQFGDL